MPAGNMIVNPILPGFNPDPSICRVGKDYYIATSTFEWYPGVQIHHSRDLVNWRLACRPLNRASQLDMRGNPDSGGIWAPCLSHADGLFWLVYTDVKRLDGNFKDTHNYIVTAPSMEGPWSDPVYVNSSGFDPSLFHDDDKRKWFLNMVWNHRGAGYGGNPTHPSFAGILLQEYDAAAGKLVGEVRNIFAGTELGLVEGPHLFKRNGWYYLTTAEGGTGYTHAVTMARSRDIAGPYELHPNKFLMTAKDDPQAPLQRTGHGQIVETPDGQVYHTHLCSRPLSGLAGSQLTNQRRSPLGRETGLQKCVWGEDDWLYLADGGLLGALEVEPPQPAIRIEQSGVDRWFDGDRLPDEFQWLRTPQPERLFTLTGTGLRLHGREAIGSWFEQALVARRQEHFRFRAETTLDHSPANWQQAAGLTHYYNKHKFHFLAVTFHEDMGRVLTIMSCEGDWQNSRLSFPLGAPVQLPAEGAVDLALEVNGAAGQFWFRPVAGTGEWQTVGPVLDASLISDEAGRGEHASFTGAFVGMAAFDTSGAACPADYLRFSYLPRDGETRSAIEIHDIETGHNRVVHRSAALIEAPNWTPDHDQENQALIFNGDGLIHRLDLQSASVSQVDTGFAVRCNNDHGISPDGTLLAISDNSGEDGQSCIHVLPVAGGEPMQVTQQTPSWWHGWSPDGQTMVYTARREGKFCICAFSIETGAEKVLIGLDGAHYDGPDYSPDGMWVWFNSDRSGSMQLWRMQADGSRPQQMTFDDRINWFPHPSPDGRHVVYLAYETGTEGHPRDRDVELRLIDLRTGTTRRIVSLFGGQGTINVPSWSADGKSFAFVRYARSVSQH